MRLIDTELGEVRAVAVSPDGRFVAASGARAFGAFEWATGGPVPATRSVGESDQIAFGPTGDWVARVHLGGPFRRRLLVLRMGAPDQPLGDLPAEFAGGLAVSPDGRVLVAAAQVPPGRSKLERWSLPGLKPASGFDVGAAYRRLAFGPNGEFLAGIWNNGFELRFAASCGLDYRHRMPRGHEFHTPGFVSFDRASATCAFGWENEFHVLDISTGTSKPGPGVATAFRDAAFSPSADRFATVGDDGRLKLWDPGTWQVVREYDWECGPLTCLAFTADGTAGVCGTADGRLVQFDVDE